jgi:hypothetical protein
MSITPYVPPSFVSSLPTAIWDGAGGLPVLPFLPGQDIAVSKGPKWSTQVIRAASGRERRTAYWPYPLWQFELSYSVIRHRPTQAELFTLWAFFNSLEGQFAPFLFVDPTDCQIPTSVLLDTSGAPITDTSGKAIVDGSSTPLGAPLGTGDGATTVFPLLRTFGGFVEPVYAAFQPCVVYDDYTVPSGYTASGDAVTFTSAPPAGRGLFWFGYFYFGCRFLQDELTFEQIVTQLWAGKSLKFTSLRA